MIISLPSGFLLSEFEIQSVLGQGAFGITYLARDTILKQSVAIKEFFPREFSARGVSHGVHSVGSPSDQENFRWGLARFLDEARILARLNHKNVIAVKRFFELNGTAYLVMDYAEGETVDQVIQQAGTISSHEFKPIFFELLDGLQHIHDLGVLHRDIKPANIILKADRTPVLLDFGAARSDFNQNSRSVTSLATPGYAPFEQYSTSGNQGPWSDLYGLAATAYRVLTGSKPQDSADRMLDDKLIPLTQFFVESNHDRCFLAVIDRCLALRPDGRPQSVFHLREIVREGTEFETPRFDVLTAVQPPVAVVNDQVIVATAGRSFIVKHRLLWILATGIFAGLIFTQSLENKRTDPLSRREIATVDDPMLADRRRIDLNAGVGLGEVDPKQLSAPVGGASSSLDSDSGRSARVITGTGLNSFPDSRLTQVEGITEREKSEGVKFLREKADRERAEREKAVREKAERDKADRELVERRVEREKAEREAERERAEREAERERIERERAEREAERERIERERAERERVEREKAERAKTERERVERERVERDNAILAEVQSGSSSEGSGKLKEWAARVSALIRIHTFLPPLEGNPEVEFRVNLRPDCSVVSVQKIKSSSVSAWDQAAEAGIKKTERFPSFPGGSCPSSIAVSSRPKN